MKHYLLSLVCGSVLIAGCSSGPSAPSKPSASISRQMGGNIYAASWFNAMHFRESENLVYTFDTAAAAEDLTLDAAVHWSPIPGLPYTLENKVQLYPVVGDAHYAVGQGGATRYQFDITAYCYGTLQPDMDMIMSDGSHRNLLAGESGSTGGPVVPINLGPKPTGGIVQTGINIVRISDDQIRVDVDFRPIRLIDNRYVELQWTGHLGPDEPFQTVTKANPIVRGSCQGVTWTDPFSFSWYSEGWGHLPENGATYAVVVTPTDDL